LKDKVADLADLVLAAETVVVDLAVVDLAEAVAALAEAVETVEAEVVDLAAEAVEANLLLVNRHSKTKYRAS
jgi:hypothetical protein